MANVDSELRPLLNHLGQAIEQWHPKMPGPADQKLSFAQKVREMARRLDVSEKSLGNWLSKSDSAFSLHKFLEICDELGVRPHSLIRSAPKLRTYSEVNDPVGAEQVLLDMEKALVPGAREAVVLPLWPTPLLKDALIKTYAQKGLYRRYSLIEDASKRKAFDETDRIQRLVDLRKERRDLFTGGNYLLRVVLMRDELEYWVNGAQLFKQCDHAERIEQIEHIIRLLTSATGNGKNRLEMRLTKAHFRAQYALFEQPDGSDVAVLFTNSGHIRLQDAETQSLLRDEFSALWAGNNYEGLATTEEWIRFLECLKQELTSRNNGTQKGPISIRAILEERNKPDKIASARVS